MKKVMLQKLFLVFVIYLLPLNMQVLCAQMKEVYVEGILSDSLPLNYHPTVIIENSLSDENPEIKSNIVYVKGMPASENTVPDSITNSPTGSKEMKVSPIQKKIINPAGSSSIQVTHTPIVLPQSPPTDTGQPK